jgi:HAD superfamily hydrolase (TIGR01509 family)
MAIFPSRRTAQIVVDRIRIWTRYSRPGTTVALRPFRQAQDDTVREAGERTPRGDESGMLDLVIFDCDGVLVDSEPIVNRTEAELFATLGFAIGEREARRRFQGMTVDQVAAAVEAETRRTLSAEQLYTWGMATALALVESLQAVPGVRELIAQLARETIPTCVASQSPLPRVRLSLAVTGLAAAFGERVFTASMVARPKPAPDLFLFAAEQMGAQPARSVVIEDSPSGVRAARAAGMTVFGYASAGGAGADALTAAGATVIRAMSELPALLDAVRKG